MTILSHFLLKPVLDIFDSAAALLWPPYCLTCDAELARDERLVCQQCWRTFREFPGGVPLERSNLRMSGRTCFEQALALYTFSKSTIALIHELKYRNKPSLATCIGDDLADLIQRHATLRSSDLIMPVPLHPVRVRERGYNQSRLLVEAMQDQIDPRPEFDLLIRVRETRNQAGLPHHERVDNVRDCFAVKNPAGIAKTSILLVDDVITTGLTMNECARTLRNAGAAAVRCLAVIHPPMAASQGHPDL